MVNAVDETTDFLFNSDLTVAQRKDISLNFDMNSATLDCWFSNKSIILEPVGRKMSLIKPKLGCIQHGTLIGKNPFVSLHAPASSYSVDFNRVYGNMTILQSRQINTPVQQNSYVYSLGGVVNCNLRLPRIYTVVAYFYSEIDSEEIFSIPGDSLLDIPILLKSGWNLLVITKYSKNITVYLNGELYGAYKLPFPTGESPFNCSLNVSKNNVVLFRCMPSIRELGWVSEIWNDGYPLDKLFNNLEDALFDISELGITSSSWKETISGTLLVENPIIKYGIKYSGIGKTNLE